jgi:hypothetical protein
MGLTGADREKEKMLAECASIMSFLLFTGLLAALAGRLPAPWKIDHEFMIGIYLAQRRR